MLPEGRYSDGLGINGDGSVVVGYGDYPHTVHAFYWTSAGGMQDLNTYLPSLGINLTGWELIHANGISADGLTIVGYGTHNGTTEAWVASLGSTCYANCDGSTIAPSLNVLDFACFINKFAAQDPYANCDHSTAPPVLNVLDFACFLNRFAAGCS